MTNTIDPITLEVLWNRLLSVVNEQQVDADAHGFQHRCARVTGPACGVFDTRGSMIAQSLTGTPGHINAMATGVRHFLKAYPAETLQAGRCADYERSLANRRPDQRYDGPYAGFQRTRAWSGTSPAPAMLPISAGAFFQVRHARSTRKVCAFRSRNCFYRDEPNHELFKIIRANVRTPDETIGDLYAQTSSNAVGARELLHFMDEFGLDSIDPLADEIITRSERAMREAIRRLPNGRYENESWSDGFDEPIRIKVAVTIEDEDMFIDFAGSSPQVRGELTWC